MKRILLSTLTILLFAFNAVSVPARPGLRQFVQPDGTIVNITVRGDEFGRMIFSEQGHLLMESEGQLEYAAFGEDGVPYASGIQATAAGMPQSFVGKLQTQDRIENWARRISDNKREFLEKRNANRDTRSELSQEDGTFSLGFGRFNDSFPVIGDQRVLVVLVEFADFGFSYGDKNYFNRMLNEEGFSDYGSLGSVREWFLENSAGSFRPEFDVYGPVKLPQKRSFYGTNDSFATMVGNDYLMAIDALDILDKDVDFSVYDGNKDGVLDNIFIIYSGCKDSLWPHQATMKEFNCPNHYYDGLLVDSYACANEYDYGTRRPAGMGTFVHEFSHVMGLPDLYTLDPTQFWNITPCEWSLLDTGASMNDGCTPVNYSSFERGALGWLEFRTIEAGDTEITPLAETNVAYAMPTENENEFFLFENRQQTGNDTFLPGHGLLVWHVDFDEKFWQENKVNRGDTGNHVDIVAADNDRNSGKKDGVPFPGAKQVTEFGFYTKPQLASKTGQALGLNIIDIAESEDGIIRFRAMDSSAVSEISDDDASEGRRWFNLQGQPISHPVPGSICIGEDGKKQVWSNYNSLIE